MKKFIKKVILSAASVAAVAAACVFGAGCGGTKILSLYDSTFTFTGKTLPLEWDKSMGIKWLESDSFKESVKELVEKHWNEIDWDVTRESWQTELYENGVSHTIAAGLDAEATQSVDSFIEYFDGAIQTIYSGLKDISVTVGSEAQTIEVTFSVPGREDVKYSLENRGVNVAAKDLIHDYGIAQIEFFTAKIAEYDALYFSVPPEDMGFDVSYPATVGYPLEFNLLRNDGGGLVSLRPTPEMIVE